MRTKNALKGSILEIIPTIILAFIGLIKTKVFISFLGSNMNGYYQFINQFVNYLFLAEAGFGTAIIFWWIENISQNRFIYIFWYFSFKHLFHFLYS